MSVSRLRIAPATLIAGALAALMLSACGGGGGDSSSSTPAPSNFAVVAGDGQATVTWDDNTAYQYWLYYAPSVSFSTVEQWSKLTSAQSKVGYNNDKGIRPPMVVTSLTNGTTYYFAMNGRWSSTVKPRPQSAATARWRRWNRSACSGISTNAIRTNCPAASASGS